MARAIISNQSRYAYRPLIEEIQGITSVLRIQNFRGLSKTDFTDNIIVRLKKSDRLDLISFELYGTSRFDWLLATFNNFKYPVEDLQNTEAIIAPSRETLFETILPELELELNNISI